MKKHVENYHKALNIYPGEVILCEVCGRHTVDIHHIVFKSQGGTDEIENLIALCTGSTAEKECCHDIAHGRSLKYELTREYLLEVIKNR